MFGFLKAKKHKNLIGFEKQAFKIWNVHSPNNAQRLRLRLAFVASASAILHSKFGASGASLVDTIQSEAIKISDDISVRIEDLFEVDVPDHSINFSLEIFLPAVGPKGSGLEATTMLNGIAAIDGLFAAFGEEGAVWVDQRSKGPFGPMGAAALFMHDIAVGGVSDASTSMAIAKEFTTTVVDMTK